jgi:hypothetical protein
MGNLSGLLATQDSSDVPVMASGINVSAQGAGSGGQLTCTIAALPGETAYLTGFEITSGGSTAGSLSTVTITGLAGGTMSYVISIPAGVTLAAAPAWVSFYPALAASGPNVAITMTLPSASGRTSAALSMQGFYL